MQALAMTVGHSLAARELDARRDLSTSRPNKAGMQRMRWASVSQGTQPAPIAHLLDSSQAWQQVNALSQLRRPRHMPMGVSRQPSTGTKAAQSIMCQGLL